MKVLGVIPARMGSSRFYGKPLADVKGKPMIQRVAELLSEAKIVDSIIIATPDEEIRDVILNCEYSVMMTSNSHPTCTDRVCEVSRNMKKYDYVLNLQGDEPIIEIENIQYFVKKSLEILKKHPNIMTNAITEMDLKQMSDPNRVKAVMTSDLYFKSISRTEESSWKQLGMYMYPTHVICKFLDLPTQDPFELDVLRFIKNSIPVKGIELSTKSLSVDTKEDLEFILNNFEII